MVVKVRINKETYDILKAFGDISDVTNRILEEAAQGKFDIMDLPPVLDDNSSRYNINIVEPEYLKLYSMYGPKSVRISLKRILQTFVDLDMYERLGWNVPKYNAKELEQQRQLYLQRAIYNLRKMYALYPEYMITSRQYILDTCTRLENERIT